MTNTLQDGWVSSSLFSFDVFSKPSTFNYSRKYYTTNERPDAIVPDCLSLSLEDDLPSTADSLKYKMTRPPP